MSNGTAKRRRPAGGSGQQPAPPTDNNSRHSESEPRCRDESSEERDTQQDQHHWLDRVPVLGRFLRLAPIDTRTELAVTGVLVLLLLSTLMGWLVVTNFTGSARFSHAFLSLQDLEVLDLGGRADPALVTRLAAAGRPVIVRNHPTIAGWPARRRWGSPQYLCGQQPVFEGVYRNNKRFFGPYHDPRRPLSAAPVNAYETDVRMGCMDFYRHAPALTLKAKVQKMAANIPPHHFVYYSGEIERFGEWALRDISPFEELIQLRPERSSINVWLGHAGVAAHCHYDGYHNFYVQLHGHKRFLILPPTAWRELHVYPFLHPSHAQCQANLSNPAEAARLPGLAGTAAWQADLQPGDMLYLPPLFFHHVEALDTSTSVNFWTDSQQTDIMEQVFAAPLPLPAPGQSQLRHTVAAIMAVLDTCPPRGVASAAAFLRDLADRRFAPLMRAAAAGLAADTSLWAGLAPPAELAASSPALQAFAARICPLFDQLAAHHGSLELWAGNWVEALVAGVVGPELTGAVLANIPFANEQ